MGILAQVRLLSQRNRHGGERSKIRQRKELSEMWFRGTSSIIFVSVSSEAGMVSQICSPWRRQSVICCGPLPEVRCRTSHTLLYKVVPMTHGNSPEKDIARGYQPLSQFPGGGCHALSKRM